MTLSTLSPARRPHRVTLQNPGPPVPDGEGGYTESWTDLNPPALSAAIENATANNMERFGPSGIAQTKATSVINVPYHPGITTETRVQYNGRSFFVVGLQNPQERNVELWLAVEERVSTSSATTATSPPPLTTETRTTEDRNA